MCQALPDLRYLLWVVASLFIALLQGFWQDAP